MEQCASTLPMRYHITQTHDGGTEGVFKHATFFCPSAAVMITHPAQKRDRNHACMNKIGIFAGHQPGGGCFSFFWPSEHKKGATYLPTVWLASWRIRLNCFFILYFLCFNAYWGVIFRIISLSVMVRAPRRRSAESTLTCFPLLSAQAAGGGSIPPLHLFSFFLFFFDNENCTSTIVPPLPAQGCGTQFTVGTHRQRATAATSRGCAAVHSGKCSLKGEWSH